MLFLMILALLQAPIPLRPVAKGPTSGIESPRQVSVRTDTEWSDLWRAHAPNTQPALIDFSREMVLGVFLGTRATGGYSVEIVRTTAQASVGLIVEYVETAPARDAITAQLLTAPFHLVAVPKRDGDVRFQKVDK